MMYCDRSFQKAAPMLYNALPVTIKTAPSLECLLKKVKVIFIYKTWYRLINVR